MELEISTEEIINELQRNYPREFTIVLQALQIKKLQEHLNNKTEESDS